jgi:hypothetical protein
VGVKCQGGNVYESKYEEAVERTRKFGLTVPNKASPLQSRYISSKVHEELPFVIRDSLGVLDEDEIVLQCLMLNVRLKKVFSKYFKCPVYYTIGYVGIDDDYMFKQSEESLLLMLNNGISGPSVNLHAWLTLPTMEILDFSISTSYGRVNNIKEMMGAALASHPSDLTGGMSYHPMIIGEEFLYRIGAMRLYVDLGI